MKFTWGRFPPYFATLLAVVGLCLIIFVGDQTFKLIVLCSMLGLTLLHFSHFMIQTKNYYIFCYCLLIWVFVKNTEGAYVEAKYNDKLCDRYLYHVGEGRAKVLYVFGERDKQKYLIDKSEKKKEKIKESGEFNYHEFLKNNRENAFLIKESSKETNSRWGAALLPEDFVWPESNGKRLELLMQFDCAEVNAVHNSVNMENFGLHTIFIDKTVRKEGDVVGCYLSDYYFMPSDGIENFKEWKGENMKYITFEHEVQVPYKFDAERLAGQKLPKYMEQPEVVVCYGRKKDDLGQLFGWARDISEGSYEQVLSSRSTGELFLCTDIDGERVISYIEERHFSHCVFDNDITVFQKIEEK